MFVYLILTLCFAQVSISSAQTTTTIEYPTLSQVTPVPNNDTALNYTFSFPINPQYATVTANYTLYEFLDSTNKSSYLAFSSLSQNCTVTGTPLCLTTAIPEVAFASGHYVIGCFRWILYDAAGNDLGTAYDCILGRTTMNSNPTPIATMINEVPSITNNTIVVTAHYPAELPYDTVTITATLNGTINSAANNVSSNATYSLIQTFVFATLTPNTDYWLCINVTSSHSAIAGSQESSGNCQAIKTAMDPASNSTGDDGGNGSTMKLCNYTLMTLLLIFVCFL